jgi:hypothetical protein
MAVAGQKFEHRIPWDGELASPVRQPFRRGTSFENPATTAHAAMSCRAAILTGLPSDPACAGQLLGDWEFSIPVEGDKTNPAQLLPEPRFILTSYIKAILGRASYRCRILGGVPLRDYAGDLQHIDRIDAWNSIQIFRSVTFYRSRRGLPWRDLERAGRQFFANDRDNRDLCDTSATWLSLHRAVQACRAAALRRLATSLPRDPKASINRGSAARALRPKQGGFALRTQNRQTFNTIAKDSGS